MKNTQCKCCGFSEVWEIIGDFNVDGIVVKNVLFYKCPSCRIDWIGADECNRISEAINSKEIE